MMTRAPSQRQRIIALLCAAEDHLSSRAICRELKITRAAVWKQIQALRSLGYSIEGVASQGYRLRKVPDTLDVLETDPGIRTARIGSTIVVKDETGSTNDDVWDLGRKGAEEGTVVIAEMQRAGKGRRGRQWISPPRRNLYLSVLLRPPFPPADAAMVSLMAGVVLCEAIQGVFGLRPRLKWPNDLLLDGKKAAGILAEMHAEQESIRFLVLGIGVNLNMGRDMFPEDLRYPATSVRLVMGRPVKRLPFVRRLLECLDEGYQRLLDDRGASALEAWNRYCAHPPGEWLEVNTTGGALRGRFRGLDEEGSMILESSPGRAEKIRAGDVVRVFREQGRP
jgi:BirA family biotin operon repressor/biotin-[acetyl-CoA-carboxylase] ligase